MPGFNHYAKIKRILADYPDGWYVRRINEPTTSQSFKGDTLHYGHYYRVYDLQDNPIKYCKFQQLERFAQALDIDSANIPIIEG